ncbi:MAG: hypothetical protein U9N42_03215 [Campylobacterota bacterium]|nr:hypothetical protein [Campylobacterota bacterium]
MLKIVLPLLVAIVSLMAHDYHEDVSSVLFKSSASYMEYENSKQKKNAYMLGIGADVKKANQKLQLWYSYKQANTYKPPLNDNVKMSKMFGRYNYTLNKKHTFNGSYMYILDNLAPTDLGNIYGAGYKNRSIKNVQISFNQYLSDYRDFNVNQSDLNLQYHYMLYGAAIDFHLIAKYINLVGYSNKYFNPKSKVVAPDDYFTTGVKLHVAHHGYHAGTGAFFGKRMFALMENGFVVQQHAMEFNETYMFKVGKKFKSLNVMLKYVFQEATELPINNKNVRMNIGSLIVHYKF